MVQFEVNGQPVQVEVAAETPLLWVLRENLGLRGTKFGCGIGVCGACTVHRNGQPIRTCITPVGQVAGARLLTIEGLEAAGYGFLQQAWLEEQVAQCGYCQAGQLMAAAALLAQRPSPTDQEIVSAMSANLCRCGTYQRIRRAVRRAAERRSAAQEKPAAVLAQPVR